MRSLGFHIAVLAVLFSSVFGFGQAQPNLENGFKPYGSYVVGDLDSVNLQNGNLILHIPMPFAYPQRGGKLASAYQLMMSSKGWAAVLQPNGSFAWNLGFGGDSTVAAIGIGVELGTLDVSLHRIYTASTSTAGTQTITYGHYLTTWDGGQHQLHSPSNTPLDPNQSPLWFDAIDGSGFHVELSSPGSDGVPTSGVIVDRQGNRFHIGSFANSCQAPVSTVPSFSLSNPRQGIFSAYDGLNEFEALVAQFLCPPNDQQCVQEDPGEAIIHQSIEQLQDGGAPTIGSAGFTTNCMQAALVDTVTDANGNVVNTRYNASPADTMGRPDPLNQSALTSDFTGCVSPNSSIPISSALVVSYPGGGGTTMQVKLCSANFPVQTNFGVTGVTEYQNQPAFQGKTVTMSLLTSVILSDAPNWTGSRWTFNYDGYLNVTDIGLPTGGSIHYDWTTIQQPTCGDPTTVSRAVVRRTVNDNNSNSSRWSYVYGQASNGVISNTVTDPLFNDTVHVFTAIDGAPNGCLFYETSARQYQGSSGSGVLLRQADTTYAPPVYFNDGASIGLGANGGYGGVFPASIKVTIAQNGSNKVNLVTRSYDSGPGNTRPSFGEVVTEKAYDWGQGAAGALLRETDRSYQWQTNSAYVAAGLVDLPASVIIKDASGNRVAETDYTYDESQYLTPSNINTQHGAAPNAVRGNATTVGHWLNTNNSFIAGHTNWYDTGEAYQTIDPLGHTTTHSYSSSFAGAYPTQTCNALSQCVSGNYDYNTGLLTSFTDANGNSSNYSYDLMWRLTLAQLPADSSGNRPQTSFAYSAPNVFPLNLQRTTTITTSLNDVATHYFDGLGRAYRSQHATPQGNSTVDTTYDGLDHVVQVTNPYYSTSDATYGVIQTQYDALGRPTQVTKQDASFTTAQYDQTSPNSANGICTTTTDEAGKSRKSCADGLGRLIEVDEPQASSGSMNNPYVTLYSYDPLGNLLSVNQKGDGSQAARLRNFTHDSLSRLLTATNPESGQISYSYDANSNLLYKTSPAPNQTGSATQTVSYCYDTLNRVNGKAYSSQSCPLSSPVVTYAYDAGTNGIGRLTSLTDQAGTANYNYDPLGRILGESRTIAGVTKDLSYSYNLDGSIATLTYPSGAVVTYAPDSAGRMLSAVDSGNNINYVTGASYGPDNSLTGFSSGSSSGFAGISNAFSFNQRLQPVGMSATSPTCSGSGCTASITISGAIPTTEGGLPWQSQDVNAVAGAPTNVLPAAGSALGTLEQGGAGSNYNETYFIGTDQHVHMLLNNISASGWGNWDVQAQAPSNVLPTAGSALAAINDGSCFTEAFFVGTDQHVHTLLNNDCQGAWGNWDVQAQAPTNVLPAWNTALAAITQGSCFNETFFIGTDGHVHMLLNNNCQGGWGNWDVQAQVPTNVLPASGSALAAINEGSCFTETYFIGTDQHVHMLLNNDCQGGWGNFDINSSAGAPTNVLPAAGSALAALYDGGNYTETFFIGADQHVHMLLNNISAGTWGNHDVTSYAGAPAALSGTPLAPTLLSNGMAVAFVSANQHVHLLMEWNWQWRDQDLTVLAGAPLAGPGGLGLFLDGNTVRVQFTGENGHVYQLLFAGNGATVSDAGTVSLSVGNFTATACFGASTNSTCTGQPANTTPSQVAAALAQALNASNSPVTASASGATVSLAWKTSGSATGVSALSTTHDNPGFFPNPSFTSPVTGFSGGMGANLPVFSIGYDFHFGNGNNGNVFGITNYRDQSRNQSFGYDALNRLISAQNAGTDCTQHTANGLTEYWGNSYGYDAWGNLLQKAVTKCSAENLSVAVLTNNQLVGYGYGAAGNMTHDATTGNNYSYGPENRIIGAAGYTYTYDADGNRVEKSNGGTGTIYWHMSPGIVAESDLTGALKSEYVFFDGERVARKDFPGNAVSFYFSDHLKTASVITDSAGNIKEDEDYYPWGGELQFVNNDSNRYKFTGKERDSETGLDYFGARYYGNWVGRFITPDWSATPVPVPYADLSDPQTFNQYAYTRDIPTSKADADGHGDAMTRYNQCQHNPSCKAAMDNDIPEAAIAGAVADLIVGLAKGATNFFIKWDNGNRDLLNKLGGHYEHLQEFKPSNSRQEKAMGVGEAAASFAITRGRVKEEVVPETAPELGGAPESIPAGPSPRPTAAQQRAINEMGNAHGCHTCGTKNPGTKSGNWVGDHQPSTALNPPGNPQVYKPQCLQCSLRQGGQVRSTQRAGQNQDQQNK